MDINNESPIIKDIKEVLDSGFKCIYYELDDYNKFTVYLKNFNTEKVKVLKFDKNHAEDIKTYIGQLS